MNINSIPLWSLAMLPLFLLSCKQDYSKYAQIELDEKLVPVRIEAISKVSTPLPVAATGILGSDREARLSFKLGGVIDRIDLEEGDRFRAGQVLATLDLHEIQAQVRKASEAVAKYQRDRNRVKNLFQDSVATLEQLQDIETALQVAQSDLEIAQFNQKYARIVARSSGRVLKRFAEPGELVAPGTPILWVSSQGQHGFVLKAAVTDKDIVRLKVGDSARVSFDAYRDQTFPATVSEIAQQSDPGSATFEVELALRSTTLPLKNGFIGKAQIYPSSEETYYRIPMDAIVEAKGKEARIFLADPQTKLALERRIQFSHLGSEYLLAPSQDQPLDLPIVTAGAAYLQNKSPLMIQNP